MPHDELPELERLMLHALADLDAGDRAAYAEYDYRKVIVVLSHFLNTDLSAFYFDIRKDTLYCEAPSSVKRRAGAHRDRPDRSTTSRRGWRRSCRSRRRRPGSRAYPDATARSIWRRSRSSIRTWRDDKLAAKWETVRNVRRVVTGALELERAAKRIGSSLEAAPEIYVTDKEMLRALEGVDLAEVCITSAARLLAKAPPEGAFTLPDVPGVGVVPARREGASARAPGASCPTSAPTRSFPICPRATPPPCASSTCVQRAARNERRGRTAVLGLGPLLAPRARWPR